MKMQYKMEYAGALLLFVLMGALVFTIDSRTTPPDPKPKPVDPPAQVTSESEPRAVPYLFAPQPEETEEFDTHKFLLDELNSIKKGIAEIESSTGSVAEDLEDLQKETDKLREEMRDF